MGPMLLTLRLSRRALTELPRSVQAVEKTLPGCREHLLRCLRTPQNPCALRAGWRRTATCAGRFGPLLPKVSSLFTFCPAAMSSASAFTFSSLRRAGTALPHASPWPPQTAAQPIHYAFSAPCGRVRCRRRHALFLGTSHQSCASASVPLCSSYTEL